MDWKLVAELLGEALKLVAQVVAERGNDEVKAAMVRLAPLLAAIDAGDLESLGDDPSTAREELDRLIATLAADRADADAALARRFDGGGGD